MIKRINALGVITGLVFMVFVLTGATIWTNSNAIDLTTHATLITEYEHHEIHAGSHYFLAGYEEAMGDGDTIEFVIVTPDTTKWAHMVFSVISTKGMTFEVYEDASSISGGSSAIPVNNNRNSTNTSDLTITKDPTSVGDYGTEIWDGQVGSNKIAGIAKRKREIILKQNTTYVFLLTSENTTNVIDYEAEWYEHTNKTKPN